MATFAWSVCVAAAAAAALANFAQGLELECLCGSYLEPAAAGGISADGDPADAAKTAFESCPPNATKFHIGNGRYVGTCKTDGYCFKSVHRQDGDVKTSYRCLGQDLLEPKERPFFCHSSEARKHEFQLACCWNSDLCNLNISIALPELPVQGAGGDPIPPNDNNLLFLILLTVPTCICILLLLLATVAWHRYIRKKPFPLVEVLTSTPIGVRPIQPKPKEAVPLIPDDNSHTTTTMTTIKDMMDSTCSGSGSGLPLLTQRSIARQIRLQNIIGQGRFGEVWHGYWQGESVAVKIFSTRDESSWFRESEIYQTVMLRHENILGFIATDNKDCGTWTQLWLVTDYHENGSLFDFISTHVVSPSQMISMALSIATGLSHLHMEIIGTQGKPAIAHRDLKSRNILVKRDMTCAIADLGLCVKHNSEDDTVDIPNNSKVGTTKYLAPEILDDSLKPNVFDSWKRADVYSLGLVFWELCRRTNVGGIYDDYQPPYFDMVPDPTIEEMRLVVCEKNIRPPCPNRWQASEQLGMLSKVMKECWYSNAAARLTALRIKKTLVELEASSIETKRF